MQLKSLQRSTDPDPALKPENEEQQFQVKLLQFIGAVGTAMNEYVSSRPRPRVFFDRAQEVLYVDEERFGGKTFHYFGVQHYLRHGAIMLICDRWFIRFVVFLMCIHSIVSVLREPKSLGIDYESMPTLAASLIIVDRILLLIFALEIVLSILAHGMRRYWSSAFHILDFVVVLVSIGLEIAPTNSRAEALMFSFNALRPARIVSRVSLMKKLVLIVVKCGPTLWSVMVLVTCLLFVFSMAGVILFSATLHVRCQGTDDQGEHEYFTVCNQDATDSYAWLFTLCQPGTTCTPFVESPSEWSNFDDVIHATLTSVQIITFDSWFEVAQDVMDGISPVAALYFFLLCVIGAFWALNLLLAVITDSFSRFFAEEQVEMEQRMATMEGKAAQKKQKISVALAGNLQGDEVKIAAEKAKEQGHKDTASHGHRSVKGTAPGVRRKWKYWLRDLSKASMKSLCSGLKSVDVRSQITEFELIDRKTKSQRRAAEKEHSEELSDEEDDEEHESQEMERVTRHRSDEEMDIEMDQRVKDWRAEIPEELDPVRADLAFDLAQPLLFVPECDSDSDVSSNFEEVSLPLSIHERTQQIEKAELEARRPNWHRWVPTWARPSVRKHKVHHCQTGLFGKYTHVVDRQLIKKLTEAQSMSILDTGAAFAKEVKENLRERVLQQALKKIDEEKKSFRESFRTAYAHPKKERILLTCVVLQCALLLFQHYGQPTILTTFLDVVVGIVDVMLVFDYIARYFVTGVRKRLRATFRSIAKLTELLVALSCFADLVLVIPQIVPALRPIRVFRLVRFSKRFPQLQSVIKTLRSSLTYLLHLLALLSVFCFIFTVVGRHIFAASGNVVVTCNEFTTSYSCEQNENCMWANATQWASGDPIDPSEWGDEVEDTPPSRTATETLGIHTQSISVSDIEQIVAFNTSPAPTPTPTPNQTEPPSRCRQFRNWFDPDPVERFQFDTFWNSFITIFTLLTKDGWAPIAYRYMSANSYWGYFFFSGALLIGGYVAMSLLVAILLVNFGKDEKEDEEDDLLDEEEEVAPSPQLEEATPPRPAEIDILRAKEFSQTTKTQQSQYEGEKDKEESDDKKDEKVLGRCAQQLFAILFWIVNVSGAEDTVVEISQLRGRSFFFLSTDNKIRLFACRVVSGHYFPFEKTVVMLCIIHSFITTVNSNLVESEAVMTVFRIVDWTIVLLTVIEMWLRLAVQGVLYGEGSYLSTGEHKTEFFIVLMSVFAPVLRVLLPLENYKYAKGIPVFMKAFRPFRLVFRSRKMRNVLFAVWKTVPAMMNILGLSLVVYLMVAVFFVEVFSGLMRTCSDGSDRSELECIGEWIATPDTEVLMLLPNETSRLVPRRWTNNRYYHFDNAFNAFTTLMEVSFVSSWANPMFALFDAPDEVGGSPRHNNRPILPAIYFLLWVCIGNIVLLNIFIGTVVDQFMRLKEQMSGSVFVTEEQSEVAHIHKLLHQTKAKKVLSLPDVPWINAKLNSFCFAVHSSRAFNWFMKVAILYNLVTIMTLHFEQKDIWWDVQSYSNTVLAFFFTVEMMIKISVAGPRAYIAIVFHRLELIVVLESWVELILFSTDETTYRSSTSLQLFRLLRVLPLLREQKGFRRLLHTGYRSLPAMGNIGSLLLVVFYVFSMIGISLFQDVRYDSVSRKLLNQNMNFRTFPRAMFTLFRVATLDNWGDVSASCGLSVPYCKEDESDCGDKIAARLYFLTFIVCVAFIMLNLFIAVVLENFSESVLLPTYMHERMNDVNVFRQVWATFDPTGRQIIPASSFVSLLRSLPGPRVRLQQLRGTSAKYGKEKDETDSVCSWSPEEMEYYAAHCAIGLQGESVASTIPTLRQLNLRVTWPAQEILFADAIDAIGEKIFHVQLVDRRIASVHGRSRQQANEYAHNFQIVDHYCASAVQAGWRRYLQSRSNPNAARKVSSKWNEVLQPILQQVWAHHAEGVFAKEETAEEAAKHRKMVKGQRMKRHEAEEGEEAVDDSKAEQQKYIKQKMSLAEALMAHMTAVDESENDRSKEDLWKTAVEPVDATDSDDRSDEELPAQQESRRRTESKEDKKHVHFLLPVTKRSQFVSLDDIICKRQKRLRVELGLKTSQGASNPGLQTFLADQVSRLPENAKSAIPIATPYRHKWKPQPMSPPEQCISVSELRLLRQQEKQKEEQEAKARAKSQKLQRSRRRTVMFVPADSLEASRLVTEQDSPWGLILRGQHDAALTATADPPAAQPDQQGPPVEALQSLDAVMQQRRALRLRKLSFDSNDSL